MSLYKAIEPAALEWKEETPFSKEFGDVYFSLSGGMEESQYVFIEKNNLSERWGQNNDKDSTGHKKTNFTIIETGFGTGLNFLCTAALWEKTKTSDCSQWLEYISFEKHPLQLADLEKCLDFFPSLKYLSTLLIKHYPPLTPGFHLITFPSLKIKLLLLFGDINNTLPQLETQADAWFLDGFSPAKNPDMWSEFIFKEINRLSKNNCTFSTFTSAGMVKRGLQSAGFEVFKTKGFGPKRDMLCGKLLNKNKYENEKPEMEKPGIHASKEPWFINPTPSPTTNKTATVIGGGLAGTTTALSLAQRGWQVTLIERHASLAEEASGNPGGVLYTKINGQINSQTEFYRNSYFHALNFFQHIPKQDDILKHCIWDDCGVLQIVDQKQIDSLKNTGELWPENIVRPIAPYEAKNICGFDLDNSLQKNILFFPRAGWVYPPLFCKTLAGLSDNIRLIHNQNICALEYQCAGSENSNQWLVKNEKNETVSCSDIVVIANSLGGNQFKQTQCLQLNSVRGQISELPANDKSKALKTVICHEGYALPAINNTHCIGATFNPRDKTAEARTKDDASNIEHLKKAAPNFLQSLDMSKQEENVRGRASFRCQSPDFLPMIGPVPDETFFREKYHGLNHGKTKINYPEGVYHPGLFVNLAHGSRGLTSTPLAAEIIAAYVNNETQPLPKHILNALNPARFLIRKLRRGR